MSAPFIEVSRRAAAAAALCGAFTACAATPPSPSVAALPLEADFAKADATHAGVADVLHLAHVADLPVHIETTTQGNGTLTVANLTLRLKDRHDDGLVYAGSGVLRLDVVPLFGPDKAPVLIVSGTALHTGDKETDVPVPEAIVYVYEVDCAAGRLVRQWRSTPVDIELDTDAGGTLRCERAR